MLVDTRDRRRDGSRSSLDPRISISVSATQNYSRRETSATNCVCKTPPIYAIYHFDLLSRSRKSIWIGVCPTLYPRDPRVRSLSYARYGFTRYTISFAGRFPVIYISPFTIYRRAIIYDRRTRVDLMSVNHEPETKYKFYSNPKMFYDSLLHIHIHIRKSARTNIGPKCVSLFPVANR